jgi:uncharacterized protein
MTSSRVWQGRLQLAAVLLPVSVLASVSSHAQSPIPFVAPPLAAPAKPTETRPPDLPQPTFRPSTRFGAQDPSIDAAYGAYQAGHFVSAFRMATDRIAANAQDAAAMTLLGELIAQGLGTRQDDRRAAEWYRLAADRGDINAQFALGMLHLEGRGVPRDEARAKALLQQAAGQGHGAASFNLALPLLVTGQPSDLQQAVTLLQRAANAEIGDAQHALAVLMLEGRGVPKDIEGGADMMARAASNGSLPGEVEFAILQFSGRGIGRDERAAARSFARAAARGNAIARNRLARILFQGRWLPLDRVAAGGWHLAARAQGLIDPDLDAELQRLSPEDRAKAEAFAEDLVSANALTKAAAAAHTTASEFKR